jgi:hypothetical protein
MAYESAKYALSGLALPGGVTYAISGAVCGIIAWCVVFPIDTAKVPHLPREASDRVEYCAEGYVDEGFSIVLSAKGITGLQLDIQKNV